MTTLENSQTDRGLAVFACPDNAELWAGARPEGGISDAGCWERLRAAVALHRVTPQFVRHLLRLENLPELVRREAMEIEAAIQLATAVRIADSVRIHRALAAQSLPHLFFKGLALAASVYPDCAARSNGDIDLLVRPEDLEGALSCLGKLGYHQYQPLTGGALRSHRETGHELPLYLEGRPFALDLHWRIAPAYLPAPPASELLERCRNLRLGNVEIPGLSAEDQFLAVAVHACKSGWEQLRWAIDLERCSRFEQLDWEVVRARAAQLGWLNLLKTALEFSRTGCKGNRPVGSWVRLLSVLRGLDGWRARWTYVAGLVFTPTYFDYKCARLPSRLLPLLRLYTFLRSKLRARL